MEVNPLKTNESKKPVFRTLITIDGDEIERVGQSKLLGIRSMITWNGRNKAATKLYYIIMLSKSGLTQQELFLVYITRI